MGTIGHLARRTAARFIPRFALPAQCGGCSSLPAVGVQMISGPGVYLCSDCIARAALQLTPRRPPDDAVRCSFCRQLRPPRDVARAGSVEICADCLGLMEVVLTEAHSPSRPA